MNRFTSVLQLKGFPIKKAEKKLREIQLKLNTPNSDYSTNQAWAIFNYHKNNNTFYSRLLKDRIITTWEDVPVMTKQDLQISIADRLSKGFSKNQVFINKTSGSSGHPFSFAKDKFAHALTWANIIKLYKQHGLEMGQSLEARFYGIPKDFKGHQKERLKDRMANRYRFDIFDLSDHNLEKFVHVFQQKPFDYINGYTSSIVMFAKYLEKLNLVLKEICPSLKICITTSEMLFQNDRKLLEHVFGVPVVNEYGASELGIIAFENTDKTWLINTNTLLVEVVDEAGKPLPFGQDGEILVTSLYNKAQPFIRYKIGDRGILAKDPSTKQITLKQLIGRTNHFAKLPSGKLIPALTFYYVTKSAIESSARIKEIVVTQKAIDQFDVDYVADDNLNKFQKQQIGKAINQYLEPNLKISFNRKPKIERSTRGKLKQFVSKLK